MAAKPKPKPKPKGPPDAARINARAAKDPAFRKRALKNPGLRSKLDPKYLAAPQRAARVLNTRLNSPITPGSTVTGRDLAHEAAAATTVRYGPQERELGQQLGVSQAVERDTGTFYDQYRQALQQHAANVQAFQAGAQQALAQTAQGITGLAGQEGAALQQQANQGAAQQGVAQAGDLSQMASNAAAVRQSLVGTFQGQQAIQGAAANQYAGAQANVVAPGQKLAAQAQARGRTQDVRKQLLGLKAEEGAFNQQFRGERRADEFKNVLAQGALNLNTTKAEADAAAKAAAAASRTPEAQAAAASTTTQAREEAKNAAKLGLSVHDYRMLGPTKRKQRLDALSKTKKGSTADTVYTSGPFAGRKKSEINALSDSERQRIVSEYNAGKGPGAKPKTVEPATQARRDFRQKYGVDLQPTSAHNRFKDQVSQGVKAFGLVGQKDKKGRPITTDAIVSAMSSGGTTGIPKLPAVVVRAALEMKRSGSISAGTANRLHRSGYSVAQLGFKTGSGARPKPRRPRQPRGPINTGAFKPIRFPRAR